MWILIVALVVIGTIAAGVSLFWDKDATIEISHDCMTCSGASAACEQNCMMEASVKDIEYFDDEELDRFVGKKSNEYSEEEAEEFRVIMETMKPVEVKAWNRSLILREINMPDQIKDEYIMIVSPTE